MTIDIEKFLGGHKGLTWKHESDLKIAKLDLAASMSNQVRTEPINEPTVERYRAALADGATFPPIIVRRVSRSLVVLGGNHRTRAHLDAGIETIDAYVVVCDDRTALEVAYADNATHGLPPTDTERLAHALRLIELGRSGREAARTVGLDPQRVYRHQQTVRVEDRAARLGVLDDFVQVPAYTRPRLESLEDDRVFVAVAKAIRAHGIPSGAANSLIADLNAQPTPKAQLELLAVHIDHHRAALDARRGVGRPSANPYLMLRTALGTVRGLHPSDVLEACRSPRERDELARLCMDGARHLKTIHDLARLAGREAS